MSGEHSPFPAAKLGPGRLPGTLLNRPRLLAQLDAASALILLLAPAGCGKSALLASWMASRPKGTPAIWYRLDAADRDPARFVDGLAAAASMARPSIGDLARTQIAAGGHPTLALATLMAAFEQLPSGIIVLDDAHHLDRASGAEAVIETLVRALPAEWRLAIASRTIPLIPAIAATSGHGLVVIARDDLRVTRDEAAALLDAQGLPTASAVELTSSAQGWAMGLILLAQSSGNNIALLGHSPESIGDTLAEAQLGALPETLGVWVRESVLLGPFTAGEADAILGRVDSAERAADALRAGMFLERHGAGVSSVYRYQDLIVEALTTMAWRDDPARARAIRRAAATYHLSDPPRALALARASRDPAFLAEILTSVLEALRLAERWETLLIACEHIPPEDQSFTMLRLRAYAAYRRGDDAQARQAAELALALARRANDSLGEAHAVIVLANPLLRQDRSREVLDLTRQVLPTAGALEGWLQEISARALLRLGNAAEGQAMTQAAVARYQRDVDAGERRALGTIARCRENEAFLLIELGEDEAAAAALSESLDLARQARLSAQMAICRSAQATLLLTRGADRAALSLAEDVLATGFAEASMVLVRDAQRVRAAAACRLGQLRIAEEALDAEAALGEVGPAMEIPALCLRARIALAKNDVPGAEALLERAMVMGPSERARPAVLLELASAALARQAPAEAIWRLGDAEPALTTYHLHPALARCLILQAEAEARLRHTRAVNERLRAAWRLGADQPWLEGSLADAAPWADTLVGADVSAQLRSEARSLVERLSRARTSRQLRLLPPEPAATPWIPTVVPVLPTLRLDPFGEGAIVWDGAELALARLGTRRAGELLSFVAWKGRPVTRDEILDALWDGADDARSGAELRQAGFRLRRILGDSYWRREGPSFSLSCPVEDEGRTLLALAASAEASAEAGDEGAEARLTLAADGLARYKADYLPWIESPWAEEPRSLLRYAALTLCQALLRAQRELGMDAAALQTVTRGLAIDPLHAGLREAEIEILAASGHPTEALATFRRYRRDLAEEGLGAPSPAVVALVRGLVGK